MEQNNLQAILSQTNLKKKYSQLNELLASINCLDLIMQNKGLLGEMLDSCFDENILIGAVVCETLFKRLYFESGGVTKYNQETTLKFLSLWEDEYIECVQRNKNNFNLNFSQQIHKVIANSCVSVIPHLINKLIQIPNYDQTKSLVWAFVSLLRTSKQEGHVIITDHLSFKEDIQIYIDMSLIKKWMFNCNRAIQYESLQVFILNTKKTAKPSDFEFGAVLEFFRYGLKTSYPNFRKNFIQKFKFFFEGLRYAYDKDFKKIEQGKLQQSAIQPLTDFIHEAIKIMYEQLIPESQFEIANPSLEILKLIYQFLGTPYELEIKKGLKFQKCTYLEKCCFDISYSESNFESLLTQAASSWDSSRILACEILNLFPHYLPFFNKQRLTKLLEQSILLIGSPIIRWYESGAQLLSWLMKQYASILFETDHPELAFLEYLYNKLSQRYVTFKVVFSTDNVLLQQNLIHGYICAFWVIMERNNLDKYNLKLFFDKLLELLREIIEFATKLSSENACTWIINDDKPLETNIQVDCRGHFFQNEVMNNVQTMLQGNTLIDSLEDQETNSENILVVSFFLITREAGMFFQQLAGLIDRTDNFEVPMIDIDKLKIITYQFFHALLNIKHIGSIDRIAQGLSYICKTMAHSKKPLLPGLVHELLDRLIAAFEQNSLKFIFRRSSGLPHLVCCLLKSCARTKEVDKVMQLLVKHSKNDVLELKIHALNILRKLFMEANLREDMEKYIGDGFVICIDCFSFDDWSVRNSSLMLFSILAQKTLGKNTNSDQLCHKLTLMEFFAKAPQLVAYFQNNIQLTDQLYPSLYPIALILSRLAPLNKHFIRKVDADENPYKVDRDQVIALLPLLVQCLKNKNYLGRQIISKSLLPFLQFEQIPSYVNQLLDSLTLEVIKKNHNNAHGVLLACQQLFREYYKIKNQTLLHYTIDQQNELLTLEQGFLTNIVSKSYIITEIKCPAVQLVVYQIILVLIKNKVVDDQILGPIVELTMEYIKEYFDQPTFRLAVDLQHSILRKKQISFIIKYFGIYAKTQKSEYGIGLLIRLLSKYIDRIPESEDFEILMVLFKYVTLQVKHKNSTSEQEIVNLTYQFFKNANNPQISLSVQHGLKLILTLSKQHSIIHNVQVLDTIRQQYNKDSQIIKYIIRIYGYIVLQNPGLAYQYVEFCNTYSNSEEIDDLRIAVIKSIKLALPALKQLQNPFKLYGVFLRLLQDEIPDIRNSMAKLISDNLLNQVCNFSQRFNYEYIFNHLFDVLFKPYLNENNIDEYMDIILSYLFTSDFYAIKKQNHQQKKIFVVEKANKYYSDHKIRQIVFKQCLQFDKIKLQDKLTRIQEQQQEFFIYNQSIYDDFTQRDEYVFENLSRLAIFEQLSKHCNNQYPVKIMLSDPSLRVFNV